MSWAYNAKTYHRLVIMLGSLGSNSLRTKNWWIDKDSMDLLTYLPIILVNMQGCASRGLFVSKD